MILKQNYSSNKPTSTQMVWLLQLIVLKAVTGTSGRVYKVVSTKGAYWGRKLMHLKVLKLYSACSLIIRNESRSQLWKGP